MTPRIDYRISGEEPGQAAIIRGEVRVKCDQCGRRRSCWQVWYLAPSRAGVLDRNKCDECAGGDEEIIKFLLAGGD